MDEKYKKRKIAKGSNKHVAGNSDWILKYDKYIPELEGRREALCAFGNGYLVSRAAAPESAADKVHYPGTYLAGCYNRLTDKINDISFEHEDLVNMPNWQYLRFRIEDDDWFDISSVEILKFEQCLDLKRGILKRTIEFRDRSGRVTLLSDRRFVHMRYPHLAGLEMTIQPKNWKGKIVIRSGLDAGVTNSGVKQFTSLKKEHLLLDDAKFSGPLILLRTHTSQSQIQICQAAQTNVFVGKKKATTKFEAVQKEKLIATQIQVIASTTAKIRIEKIVATYTSRDKAISEPGIAALEAISASPSFASLVSDHVEEWRHLWSLFDLQIRMDSHNPDMSPQLIVHLHSFHVLQTASPHTMDLDVGIPARGWTGEAYQGHIFWDDLFVFPFLNLRMPEITRSMLMYRYRRLGEARRAAKSENARGAKFPWQSGSNGREETPQIIYFHNLSKWAEDATSLQVHVNAAIAYNLWQYLESTGNLDFMNSYGAEILFEIARYFASIARFNKSKQRYEIKNIVGPDEWHTAYPDSKTVGIDNNAYTNLMVVWTLIRALDLIKRLADDRELTIRERLDITDDEVVLWDKISRNMFVPVQPNGLIMQFEGYEKLKEFPWKNGDKLDLQKVESLMEAQGGNLNQYKVSKQADVLMLFYLFSADELKQLLERTGYRYSRDLIPKNIIYYTPQTAHSSTLSRVTHAWVLSRLDRKNAPIMPNEQDSKKAYRKGEKKTDLPHGWEVFLVALSSDFCDIQGGTTHEGIHMGAMAGTLDIIQRCYTGIVIRDDVLWLAPRLPDDLISLSFNLRYRKQSLRIEITHSTASVCALQPLAEPVNVGFDNEVYELADHKSLQFALHKERNKSHKISA